MRLAFFLAGLVGVAHSGLAQTANLIPAANLTDDAWKLELTGQAAEAQVRLERAASATPVNLAALRAYAEFLDRYHDPVARQAYLRLTQALDTAAAPAAQRAQAYRRLASLDLAVGDRDAATRHLAAFTAAGGSGLSLGAALSGKAAG